MKRLVYFPSALYVYDTVIIQYHDKQSTILSWFMTVLWYHQSALVSVAPPPVEWTSQRCCQCVQTHTHTHTHWSPWICSWRRTNTQRGGSQWSGFRFNVSALMRRDCVCLQLFVSISHLTVTHIAACNTKRTDRAVRITRFVVDGEFSRANPVIAAVLVITVGTIRVLLR